MRAALAARPMPATEVAASIRAGRRTAEDIFWQQMACIELAEPEVGAWHYVSPDTALAEAQHVDRFLPLAGVTFGIKDVIDTANMPTGYGSAAYEGSRPVWDAPIVTLARQAGGVMLGKTVCTEFAMSSPGKTRNPANLAHTPGGSSSGSCAAVAAGMVQVGFGTQTSGSIIRPAAYCGVVGYKPSFGMLNRTGVKVLSDSLDTVGLITGDVADAALVASVLAERPELMPRAAPRRLRVGIFHGSRWHLALPETAAALEQAASALAEAGCMTRRLPVPGFFEGLYAHHDAVMGWETPRSLAYERSLPAGKLTAVTHAFLDQLSQATLASYDAALGALETRAGLLDQILDGCDVLLTPAAAGEAPLGLETTGDPVFNKVWTLLHGPCVALPVCKGPSGLPVGVQIIGRLGGDADVLAAAVFIAGALAAQRGGM